ncbi:hypothetical protein BDQ17DRAFT_1206403, partial [Cyathus striatus]
ENMAEAIWETLTMYDIQDQIMAFMLDNASNNDTFIDGIVSHCKKHNIDLNPMWICLWCMPHTVHLAAIQLLEATGAVSCSDSRKAAVHGGNYQLSVIAPFNSDNSVFLEDDEND